MRPSDPSGRAARSSRFHRAWCASTVVTQVLLTEEADSPTPTWFCLVALLAPPCQDRGGAPRSGRVSLPRVAAGVGTSRDHVFCLGVLAG